MLTNVTFKLQSETVRRVRAIREESYRKNGSRISDDQFINDLLELSEKATVVTKKGEEPVSQSATILNSLLNSASSGIPNSLPNTDA